MTQYVLKGDGATAAVNSLGAELQSWSVGGRSLLWQPDARWWAQTCPVLFPVCGWLREGVIRVDGRAYPLGLHGFASRSDFTVLEVDASSVTLELRDDARTQAEFPFGFRLLITYRFRGAALQVRFAVDNTGGRSLPYGLGLHPGFAWPFSLGAREDYLLRFERPEHDHVPLHENGLISARERVVPMQGRILPLSDALFEPGGLNMRDAASRSVAFCAPDGSEILLEHEDMHNIVVWTRPGAPFLCVEGWCGTNDPVGFTGDIMEKPGMRRLEIGAQATHAVTMTFQRAV